MKLKKLRIVNFRCFDDVPIEFGSMHAIVGANSAGKSTVVHALEFLFSPSAASITPDWFHHRNIKDELRVEALFSDLSAEERTSFKGYLRPDDTFNLARTAQWVGTIEEGSAVVSQAYNKPQPQVDWLNPEVINAEQIKKWSAQALTINGQSFIGYLGGTTKVGDWKDRASQFSALYLRPQDYSDSWADNPKGFSGVLKGNLPHFELVPAVRDVGDEGKVAKTNPFGRLIRSVVDKLDPTLRTSMDGALSATTATLNRGAGNQRVQAVAELEQRLSGYVREIFSADVELEFEAPTVETILSTPQLLIDDGFRGPIEYQGHGLQRAMIMSILRAYSDLATRSTGAGNPRTLVLAIEEPELYMHPPMLRTVRRVLRKLADSGDQVIFTTHNPIMVDVRYFDEIIRVDVSKSKKASSLHQLQMGAMVEDLEVRYPNVNASEASIRERYSHVYTSTRNEGFFARSIILVEGQTELYCLPIYAAAMNLDFDKLGMVVVECGTKDQIDRLFRIFNELGTPCYVLFDYDLGGDAQQRSIELLEWFELPAVPPTAPVVGNRVAYFVRDWETDLRHEIPNYEVLSAKATKEIGLRPGENKPLRARYIARALTAASPPDVPRTIQQIITQAVKVQHAGSCLRKK